MPPDIEDIANAGFPPEIWWIGGAIILLLIISAFFSGSETALTAAIMTIKPRLLSERNGVKTAENSPFDPSPS